MGTRSFGQYKVELSNQDKVLFKDSDVTKGDIVSYYERIAPVILPHLRGRAVTLKRYPDGIDSSGFVQQSRPDYFPDWLKGISIDHGGDTGKVEHVLCENQASLAYLANQGVITLHRWLSHSDKPHYPDLLIFDLDPSGEDFDKVRNAAFLLREAMVELDLVPYVMSTGSRGLHVVTSLKPTAEFERVRELGLRMARGLAGRYPDQLTTEQRKNKRKGRLYLDVMRNAFGQTAVCPYAIRARKSAPVATPLEWSELENDKLDAQTYGINSIFRRLGQKDDPWANLYRHGVNPGTLEKALSAEGL